MTSPLLQPYPRTRTTGALTKGASFIESASGPAANYTNDVGPGAAVGASKTMSDIVTPGFRRLSADGAILMRPMNWSEVSHNPAGNSTATMRQTYPSNLVGQIYSGSGDQVSKLVGGTNLSTTTIPGTMLPKQIVPTTTVDRAIREACTKAHRIPSDANLLVTFAEINKTMRLVPDLFTNWARFFQSFHGRVEYRYGRHLAVDPKRQSVANLRAIQRLADETWLAMRFGVRPLIMDTVGVMKALATELAPEPTRVSSRGRVICYGSDVTTWNHASGIMTATVVTNFTQNVTVRAMTLFELAIDSYQQRTGLSIGQVPEAVIDLVRFSFVVNWVLSLNEYFAAIGASLQPGVKSLGSCYTVLDERSRVMQVTNAWSTNTSFSLVSSPSGVGTVSVRNKYRIVGLQAPTISLRANPLKFLTDWRLIDAIALLSVTGRRLRTARLA